MQIFCSYVMLTNCKLQFKYLRRSFPFYGFTEDFLNLFHAILKKMGNFICGCSKPKRIDPLEKVERTRKRKNEKKVDISKTDLSTDDFSYKISDYQNRIIKNDLREKGGYSEFPQKGTETRCCFERLSTADMHVRLPQNMSIEEQDQFEDFNRHLADEMNDVI